MVVVHIVDEYTLRYDATTPWKQFVYTFATVHLAESRFGNTWLVQSSVYWSVEATLICSIMIGTMIGNLYYYYYNNNCYRQNGGDDAGTDGTITKTRKTLRNSTSTSITANNTWRSIRMMITKMMIMMARNSGTEFENDDRTVETEELAMSDMMSDTSDTNHDDEKPACFTIDEGDARLINKPLVVRLGHGSGSDAPPPTARFSSTLSELATAAVVIVMVLSTTTSKNEQQHTQRLYYLDNAKILLIVLVILQHIAEIQAGAVRKDASKPTVAHGKFRLAFFLTLNSSYFMQLFFFISAYFIPASLTAKGPSWFLQDKLRRLGFTARRCILCPQTVRVLPGPCRAGEAVSIRDRFWFSKSRRYGDYEWMTTVPLPRLTTQLTFGLLLGLVQGGIAYAQSGDWFQWGFLRLQWAYAPSYFCFFTFGILAQKNNWLRELRNRSRFEKLTHFAVEESARVALVAVIQYRGRWSVATMSFAWGIASAMMNLSFPVVLLAALEVHVNFSTKWTQIMSRAAYPVYLLHLHLLMGLSSLWWTILYNATGLDVLDPNFVITGGNEWVIAGGGVAVTLAGVPLIWLVCW